MEKKKLKYSDILADSISRVNYVRLMTRMHIIDFWLKMAKTFDDVSLR